MPISHGARRDHSRIRKSNRSARESVAFFGGGLLCALAFPGEAEAFEGEVFADLLDALRLRGDERSETARRENRELRAGLCLHAMDEAVDHGDVAPEEARLHRVDRVGAD